MTARMAWRLAWPLLALYVLFSVVGLTLLAASPGTPGERSDVYVEALFAAGLLVFALVGAVLMSRRPENPIGWLLSGMSILEAVWVLTLGYARFALYGDAALPGGTAAGWLTLVVDTPPFALAMLLVLLFPTGRLPSRRWRVLPVAVVAWITVVTLQNAFASGPLEYVATVDNPLGIEALEPFTSLDALPLGTPLFVAAFASLVVRFRRANGVERQQLKWFLFWASLVALFLVAGAILEATVPENEVADYAAGAVFAVLITAIAVSIGIAILRYRLYDIDVVIRRTLVYGVLTATLVLTYVGSVLLLQLVLRPLTEQSDLAIAGSTLAVAALFRPARRRIQQAVDHRFYRRRYDAARTLESFGARLRDELDLDTLGTELGGVVRETMQPAHVSLWLREAGR